MTEIISYEHELALHRVQRAGQEIKALYTKLVAERTAALEGNDWESWQKTTDITASLAGVLGILGAEL